jgi:hypothetical protein
LKWIKQTRLTALMKVHQNAEWKWGISRFGWSTQAENCTAAVKNEAIEAKRM